jgi:acyl carrier protein
MRTADQTLNEIIALAAAHFKVPRDKLTPDADFSKMLGKFDSMQLLDMVTKLEQHFNIEIPDYEVQGVSDFRTLAERIQARL